MLLLGEEEILNILNWDDSFKVIEVVLKAVSESRASINPRLFSTVFDTPKWMVTMSGYLDDNVYGGWACKILTGNPENAKLSLPTFSGNIVFFDANSGITKAVADAREITNYRTAATSAVATKHLYLSRGKPQKVLAILGTGEQGKSHAEAFYQYFQFVEIRLWNRTKSKAEKLVNDLNIKFNTRKFKYFEDNELCVRDADVIITTTTPGPIPIVQYEWVKKDAHINAVGVSPSNALELDNDIYNHAKVYVDHRDSAALELKKLKLLGADITTEVGQVILKDVPAPASDDLTVFQSLGLIVEDCAMMRWIYDKHTKEK